MLVALSLQSAELYSTVHEIIRMAYPRARISLNQDNSNEADVYMELNLESKKDEWQLSGKIESGGRAASRSCTISQGQSWPANAGDEALNGLDKELKISIKRFCLQLLRVHEEKMISAYGILTGVRPVKIVHRFLDEFLDDEQIMQALKEDFLVDKAKAELLLRVAHNNRSCLAGLSPKRVSVYIGIPYCPSRCYYCSFPGAVLKDYKTEMKPFIKALLREMNIIGDYLKEAGLKVQTIYLGGGTPSILQTGDLAKILDILENKFNLRQAREVTMEAGRPDTLSPEKFDLMKSSGVDRICINPQTMNDKTLELISRRHNVQQVVKAVEMARKTGIKMINMDLIVGLPGESTADHIETIKQITALEPENITIHTLAVKRGSLMAQDMDNPGQGLKVGDVEQSLTYIYEFLKGNGYQPYYLYRQKYTRGNMENVGYSKDNRFCLYNILMIEEKQTIIGMGGGAGSKLISSQGNIHPLYNPKDPETYCQSAERLAQRKVDNLRALN